MPQIGFRTMKKIGVSCLFILMFTFSANADRVVGPFQTEILSKGIKTLQVGVVSKKYIDPIIELNGPDVIEINFDALQHAPGWFAYTITHCNADWTPSSISSSEYLEGFENLYVDDFANSLNTTKFYTNYHLYLPNEDVKFNLSGNYVVKIFNENAPKDILLTACFSIVESKVDISAHVRNYMDTISDKILHQVNFIVNHPDYEVTSVQTAIKASVFQNQRRDNAVFNIAPASTTPERISYQQMASLTFNPGNEYRRMEFLNNKEKGMRVSNISFKRPYHYITLMTDHSRSTRPYINDSDLNGNFIIRNTEVEDPDTEADYDNVHFTLHCDSMPGGNIYLNGTAFNNTFNDQNQMIYNAETGTYEKSVILKQGTYNYQYLFVPDGKSKGETFPIEGDFSDSENKYLIMVYHRPEGVQYDRLIGVKTISSAKQSRKFDALYKPVSGK